MKRNEECEEKQSYEAQELMQFFFGSFVVVSLTELSKLSMLRRESLGNLPNLGGWQPRQGEVLIEQHPFTRIGSAEVKLLPKGYPFF